MKGHAIGTISTVAREWAFRSQSFESCCHGQKWREFQLKKRLRPGFASAFGRCDTHNPRIVSLIEPGWQCLGDYAFHILPSKLPVEQFRRSGTPRR